MGERPPVKFPTTGVLFLLSVLMLSMILVSGCIGITEAACGALGDDRDHCIQKVAELTKDAPMCDSIDAAPPKSKCYILVAAESRSAAPCFWMKERTWYGESGTYTADQCLQYFAVKVRDPSVCDGIQVEKPGLRSDLSPQGVSPEICDRLVGECGVAGKPACYRHLAGRYYCDVNNTRIETEQDRIC